uniref:THAP-type domain-containing protein n=1 Tax=Angiostrongylus cantonensis TaxID=6313 RepID=A0A0K0D8X0_ANGCA
LFFKKCESYQDTVCSGDLEWTGGLMEVNNGTHTTLKTECCTYPGMYRSYLIRTVLLGKDDRLAVIFSINSVALMSDNSTSFDLIKAVRKAINSDNRLDISTGNSFIPCLDHALKILSRNKRRLNVNKKKGDNYDYVVEVVR